MPDESKIPVTFTVRKTPHEREYVARFRNARGERIPSADYFSEDRADATQTARVMVDDAQRAAREAYEKAKESKPHARIVRDVPCLLCGIKTGRAALVTVMSNAPHGYAFCLGCKAKVNKAVAQAVRAWDSDAPERVQRAHDFYMTRLQAIASDTLHARQNARVSLKWIIERRINKRAEILALISPTNGNLAAARNALAFQGCGNKAEKRAADLCGILCDMCGVRDGHQTYCGENF